METIYDRLGDLLSETLREGRVRFMRPPEPEKGKEPETHRSDSEKADASSGGMNPGGNEKAARGGSPRREFPEGGKRNSGGRPREKKMPGPVKFSPEAERALRLLGVSPEASFEEVRKAYKEKLKYFHPDRHASNNVLQQVATKKTAEIIRAFELLEALPVFHRKE